MVAADLRSPVAAGLAQPAVARGPGRFVVLWLGVLIVLVFAMVLVGGATRLTESGLSITEWKLVAGTLPPMSDDAWRTAFDAYRDSPQYALLNAGMSLADYKRIYWWEWAHRELGRFIGLVYLAGFLWIAVRRLAGPRIMAGLVGLGLLLGLQGVVGWIMVASGLQPGMTAVAPVKLTLHLTLAALFFTGIVSAFVRVGGAVAEPESARGRAAAWALVAAALAQIAFGGLVAGHNAGLTYNTWPLMDGRLVPDGLLSMSPAWLNAVDNVTAVQFNHRLGAYVVAALVLAYAAAQGNASGARRHRAILIVGLTAAQIALGILTLIHVVPIGLALAHQGAAMLLLLTLAWNASVLRPVARGVSPRLAPA